MKANRDVRQKPARESEKGRIMLWKMLARRAASRAMRVKTGARSEEQASRAEQMGQALRVRDDALWNPFEVIAMVFLIIFSFGFLLGQSHYLFVAELFFPVVVIGAMVVALQTVLRWRAGDYGLLGKLHDLLRGRNQENDRSDRAHH